MLDRVEELLDKGVNPILELDCGLGKRFMTHQLITKRFPDLRFIVVANSTGSQEQTVDYFKEEYGDYEDEVGDLSSHRTPYYLRRKILEEKRIIVTTASVFANIIDKYRALVTDFDVLIINEVDKIVRRVGGKRALVYPWSKLILVFKNKWIIGMTGTLRDEHMIYTGTGVQRQKDVDTLLHKIPHSAIIPMEEFMDSDINDYREPTEIEIVPVDGGPIKAILAVIDLMISDLRPKIRGFIPDVPTSAMHLDMRVPHSLAARYSWLLLLRKFVYARPPRDYMKYLNNRFFKTHINYNALCRTISRVSPKVDEVVRIAGAENKTVVLCSYLDMVNDVEEMLIDNEIAIYKITGQVSNKGEVLRDFRNHKDQATLIMSPVGERDLDIAEANIMVVCDAINTSKTMYQRIKRTRGGRVVFLVFDGTSEVNKIKRLIMKIMEKYPWSVECKGASK